MNAVYTVKVPKDEQSVSHNLFYRRGKVHHVWPNDCETSPGVGAAGWRGNIQPEGVLWHGIDG